MHHYMKAVFLNKMQFISPFYDKQDCFYTKKTMNCWVNVNIINFKKVIPPS